MRTRTVASVLLALGLVSGLPSARGQVRERDVTITGPRGRSIERSFRSERGPGFLERDTTIRRPGGTFERDVRIQRGPGFAAPLPHGGGGFVRGGGFRPPVFLERDVVVNRGIPWWGALGIGAGSFGLGMLTGSALSAPPPPPVAVYPAPVVVAPAPGVVYAQPQPYSAAPTPPPTAVIDPVPTELTRLQSFHASTRRDACGILGRLRDPRAIPALVERLKYDHDKDVRIAAATALGDIGDPQTIVLLERATIYDKKQEVRDAAALAMNRLQQVADRQATDAAATQAGGTRINRPSAAASTLEPIPQTGERVPPPPSPVTPGFSETPR